MNTLKPRFEALSLACMSPDPITPQGTAIMDKAGAYFSCEHSEHRLLSVRHSVCHTYACPVQQKCCVSGYL